MIRKLFGGQQCRHKINYGKLGNNNSSKLSFQFFSCNRSDNDDLDCIITSCGRRSFTLKNENGVLWLRGPLGAQIAIPNIMPYNWTKI